MLSNSSDWPQTPEERAARLKQLSAQQQQRLATETPQERARRLENLRQQREAHPVAHEEACLPLLDQQRVKQKMAKFHQEMSTIETHSCSVCMEKFPGLKVGTRTSECLPCSRDKVVPKLYSAKNNMHPGTAPLQLQVK